MSEETRDSDWTGQRGFVVAVLARLMTAFGGKHPESYREGFKNGYMAGQHKTPVQSSAKPTVITREVAVRIEDARGNEAPVLKFDALLLDDGRMSVTPPMIKQFKADALANLGEDHQPSDEQWTAILSPTTSAVTIGIAGTGKTFVMMMRAVFMH